MTTSTLAKYFGTQAAGPSGIVGQDRIAEQFTRGRHGGRGGAGVWTQYGQALAGPAGRIHWARRGNLRRAERLHGRRRPLRPPRRRRNPRQHHHPVQDHVSALSYPPAQLGGDLLGAVPMPGRRTRSLG